MIQSSVCEGEKEYLQGQVVYRAFQNSGKRHLLLTGSRGTGKSVLYRFLGTVCLSGRIAGFESACSPERDRVYLTDPVNGRRAIIGRRVERDGKAGMETVPEGFLQEGMTLLEAVMDSPFEWAGIDEIGFLETSVPEYCEQLLRLMEKKRLLAVVRKQELPFLQALLGRKDAFVVDLDEPFGKMGCVIMASGLGKRFGGNKLLADFAGASLLERVLQATEGVFAKRVVVTRSEEVENFCRERGVEVIRHTLPYRSDTVRLGIQSMGQEITHCMFVPGDQPLLRRETVQTLALTAGRDTYHIYRLRFGESVGAPVIFPKGLFEELERLPEGKGGGYLADKYPEHVRYVGASCGEELEDVDTREDLERLLNICKE